MKTGETALQGQVLQFVKMSTFNGILEGEAEWRDGRNQIEIR